MFHRSKPFIALILIVLFSKSVCTCIVLRVDQLDLSVPSSSFTLLFNALLPSIQSHVLREYIQWRVA